MNILLITKNIAVHTKAKKPARIGLDRSSHFGAKIKSIKNMLKKTSMKTSFIRTKWMHLGTVSDD